MARTAVVVGGGVNGLLTARALATEGWTVTLLERGQTGREASWAGGGIVSPLYPWRYSAPVTALAKAARAAYPQLAATLLAETGIDPEFERCGMLMLDAPDADAARQWAADEGEDMQPLLAAALQARAPWLAPGWREGLWMPAIANIRNPRLLQALLRSLQQRGVTVETAAEVVALQRGADRVSGVRTADGRVFEAGAVVLCGGAWTATLLRGFGLMAPPVRPVRGQMLLYRLAPGALPCIVLAEGRYVIPRRDGHVLCGSTLEEAGFDKSVTAEALASLQASAARLLPALAGLVPLAQWAGLRPGSPAGVPFIGPVPGVDGLWVNAGQFRNGLVLAPASVQLLVEQMAGRTPTLDPAPYQWAPAS